MRVGAAEEAGVGLLRQSDVVGVLPGAGEKAVVFLALDRTADEWRSRLPDAVVTEIIKRGQSDGTFRPDFDAVTKAVEILAFINGMETLWLLDRSISLTEVFKGYAESLGRELAPRSST